MTVLYSSHNVMINCLSCGSLILVPVLPVPVICPHCHGQVGVGA